MPPPPGSSPAAAPHRPRGLPAGRSRVRGMSVGRRRPPAGALGLAAFRELRGSASGARGLGPGQGAWGGVPQRRFKKESKPPPPKTPGKPRPGARARDEAPESEGIPAGRGRKASSLARPGGSEGPRLAVASPGLSRGWERAGSPPRTPSPRETSRPRGARRGRAEGLVSGRAQSFAH